MVEKLSDVWESRDMPVLIAVVARIDQGEAVTMHATAEVTGLDVDQVRLSFRALERQGLVTRGNLRASGDFSIVNVSGDAYRLAGLHPDREQAAQLLVQLFEQAAERSADPVERSKLQKAALAIGDVGGQVVGNVLAAVLARLTGIA